MGDNAPRLSVVLPAFNEARRLAELASRFQVAVDEGALCQPATELILVDDGSSDGTAARAEELLGDTFQRLRVLRLHDNRGKGAAVRLGVAAAAAPVVLFMDADMSVDPSEIPGLIGALDDADVAIGSRSVDASIVETDGVQRKIMGWTFNAIVGVATGLPYRDTQCGFKAFRTPVARILFHLMTVERFAFDVELLYLARQMSMGIVEVPVHWREMSHSTVRMVADPVSMTRDVLGVRWRRKRPYIPGLAVVPAPGERRTSPSRIVATLHAALGPNYPILVDTDGHSVVLLPLCGPGEIQEMAGRLRRLPTRLAMGECSVSLAQLRQLGPLTRVEGEHGAAALLVHAEAGPLVGRPPQAGWQSVRSSMEHPCQSQLPA
jgi:hypothetical protein